MAVAIELSPDALAKFAGSYEFPTGLVMAVTVEDGRLWLARPGGEVTGSDNERRTQLSSQLRQDLLPSSPTKFFFRQFEATAEFEFDADGEVTGLVQRQAGRDVRAKRIR